MEIDPKNLRKLRASKNWSRQKLADKSKVSARQIARIESSKVATTVRSTTVQRLAHALKVDSQVLSGSKPVDTARAHPAMVDSRHNLKISSGVQLAYDLVRHCYHCGPSFNDIVNLAPLFFVLLAEGSLVWRKQCLKEIDEALDRLDTFAKEEDHLYFAKYKITLESGYCAEEGSIEKADICGETIRDDNALGFDFSNDESLYKLHPFMAYLCKLSRDIGIRDKVFPMYIDNLYGEESYIYGFLKDELEEITGGSHDAEWALRSGDVRLSEIPEELMPEKEKDDRKNERVAWLEGKLSDESRAKLMAPFSI